MLRFRKFWFVFHLFCDFFFFKSGLLLFPAFFLFFFAFLEILNLFTFFVSIYVHHINFILIIYFYFKRYFIVLKIFFSKIYIHFFSQLWQMKQVQVYSTNWVKRLFQTWRGVIFKVIFAVDCPTSLFPNIQVPIDTNMISHYVDDPIWRSRYGAGSGFLISGTEVVGKDIKYRRSKFSWETQFLSISWCFSLLGNI